ncbi:MAG: hypothetical protein CVT92_05840 [Bacteroidetes bacterium HGW-Bacteroidetes-1]|nr:MAG: hypothetical protein CVT92_05840 [Bacteroidetes bacterium HGW-Bacteroidetes-1]
MTYILVNFLNKHFFIIGIIFALIIFNACEDDIVVNNLHIENNINNSFPDTYEEIHELKRGDILVRPNLNFLPGSSSITNGSGFGHAALVVKGFMHENTDSLLAGAIIIESIAKDVPVEFQVREISGLVRSKFDAFNNNNFDNRYLGNRYRLRLPMEPAQLDSIIAFALMQKNDHSSWNASKSFPDQLLPNDKGIRKNWADNATWYCSLLVWQSVLYATGLDIDSNQGYMVYPNDLIRSSYFDNSKNGFQSRVKF